MRQPLVPPAGRHHAESGGARPVDQVADDRRLVAVGEAVDYARLGGLAREQRAAERVGLDGHHHHVLAVAERGERVLDRRERVARRFDDDVDRGMRHQRLPVVRDVRARFLDRSIQRRSAVALGVPAHALQIPPGVLRREIGDAGEVHAGRVRHLRDVHGAELARADDADAQRLALRRALTKLRVEIHAAFSSPWSSCGGVPCFQGSGTA